MIEVRVKEGKGNRISIKPNAYVLPLVNNYYLPPMSSITGRRKFRGTAARLMVSLLPRELPHGELLQRHLRNRRLTHGLRHVHRGRATGHGWRRNVDIRISEHAVIERGGRRGAPAGELRVRRHRFAFIFEVLSALFGSRGSDWLSGGLALSADAEEEYHGGSSDYHSEAANDSANDGSDVRFLGWRRRWRR